MTTTLRPTLAATTLDHIRWMRLQGLSETTICQRRHALCRVARHAGVPLRDITEDQLIDWLESLSSLSHLSPVTIYLYVSHISEFYKWVTIRGLRADNPAARLPRPRLPRRLPRPVTETDLAAALDCAPQPIRLWLVLAAWCGLRCKEIALLKRECIRENDTPPVLLVDAGATKGRSERVVPLSSFVTGEIAAAGLPAAGWAFRRADGPAAHAESGIAARQRVPARLRCSRDRAYAAAPVRHPGVLRQQGPARRRRADGPRLAGDDPRLREVELGGRAGDRRRPPRAPPVRLISAVPSERSVPDQGSRGAPLSWSPAALTASTPAASIAAAAGNSQCPHGPGSETPRLASAVRGVSTLVRAASA